MTFRLRHVLAAVCLHGMLITLLVTGVQCSHPPERPAVIQAVLLDPNRLQVAQQKKQQQQQEAQRRQEQQRKEQQQKLEQQRQEQIQKQKAADEQKRQQEVAQQKHQQQLADQQRKQKEAAEKKKAEEAARKKQEQQEAKERQQQAQMELQDKARMEDEMRRETAQIKQQEQQDAQAATDRQRKQSEWAAILQDHIREHWNPPANAPDKFNCTVRVQLLPDGSVTRAKISQSCGNPQLDRSVEDAALRASPLPKPADPSVFDRDLIINFEP